MRWCKYLLSTMEKPELIKILLFLILVINFLILYVPDVVLKYRNKATTITTKREPIEEITWPAITFCMEKAYKPSVLREAFGSTHRSVFTSNDHNVTSKKSLNDLYFKATYRRGRDFYLADLNDYHKVKEMPTEDYGMCYSILQESTKKGIFFGIVPKQALLTTEDNPKGVSIFLTTKNTRHFLINGLWPLKPLIISKKFAPKYYVIIKVEETEWRFHDGNPDCQRGCQMSQCLKWSDILDSKYQCQNLCVPVVLSGLYRNVSEPICGTLKENTCMYKKYRKLRKTIANCGPPQNDIQYDAYVKDDEVLSLENDQQSTVYVNIEIPTDTRVVKEEIRIYDDASLVGTLGGTLGLMIGFSFYGLFDYIINKLFNRF